MKDVVILTVIVAQSLFNLSLRLQIQELQQRCDWQRDKISELVLEGLDDETGIVGHPLPWPRPEVPEIGVM